MSLWSRFVNVFRNERMIDDIDEELSAHIADAIEHCRDPEELRRAFGPLLRHREASRDLRRIAWFGDLLMDLRYGARVLRCQPAFFAAAVLSLGVGIGANAAIFSVTDALLLRSLPVSHPEQLVLLRDSVTDNFSYPEFVLLRDGSRTLSGLIAASPARPVPVAIGGYAGQASTKMVSGNYFAELGIAAEMGRVFSAADETMPVAVISDDYWHRQFGGSARVLGGTVAIAGMPVSIVGIAPPRFAGETPGESPDIWTSLGLRPAEVRADRGFTWLYLLGRRKPGRTVSQIHDDLAALLVQARPTAPSAETKARLIVGPGARGIQMLGEHLADPLRVAMMLASLVLLIVCTNLASLLLARGTARRWEIAMRIAIGASRARALRQLLTESALLAAAGGALAMVVGVWGGAALLRVPVGSRPIVLHTGLNLRVVVFTAGVSTIAALLFGLAPAWRATRAAALRGSTHIVAHEHAGGVRHALIAVQVALSMVLMAGSVMFVRTIRNAQSQDLGFRTAGMLLVPLSADRGYHPQFSVLVPNLLDRVEHLPGVTSASVAVGGTFDAIGGARVQVEGRATRDRLDADWVGPDYLRTAGIAIVAGRDFTLGDDARHQKVVIVNQTMARQYFGIEHALGRRVAFNKEVYDVVGVASDAKYADLRETTPPFIYFPTLQTRSGFNTLEVRMATPAPLDMASTIASLVHDVDPHLNTGTAMTLSDRIDRKLGREHLVADVSGLFGALALALLAIGIYGSVAYSVGQRRKEIAVRLALGADGGTIVWMVVRRILEVLALGLIAGGVGVAVAGRLVKPLLFGIAPTDPTAIASAMILLIAVAIAAGWLPARAASRLDPAAVLQE